MFTHEEMIGFQSEKHELIDVRNFRTREEYVLHLIHSFAYVQACILAENKTVLDLGCNTGYGSVILSKVAKKVVGVDVSERAISTSKKQHGHLGIDFQLIDGKQLPFADNEFDMIISCQVIEHIVDYNIYFNELKRVLSPLGIVIFTTPNALLRLDPGMKPWNKFHVREFEHSELQALLSKHFLEVQIMGLFADEPLYLIEKNRLSRAREKARRRSQRSIRSVIKRMSFDLILTKLRKLKASSLHSNQEIDKMFIEKYGVGDFFYRTDNLSMALDLLAICTDNTNVIKSIKQKLKTV